MKTLKSRFLEPFAPANGIDYQERTGSKIWKEDLFQGKIILPQFWPKRPETFQPRKIAVIWSGLPAINLVPSLGESRAGQVDQWVQRSPKLSDEFPNRNGQCFFSKKNLRIVWRSRPDRSTIFCFLASFGFSERLSRIMKKANHECARAKTASRRNPVDNTLIRVIILGINDSVCTWRRFFTSINKGQPMSITVKFHIFPEKGVQIGKNGDFSSKQNYLFAHGL